MRQNISSSEVIFLRNYIFRLDYVTSDKDPSKTTLTQITAMIANFAEKLPTFKFFTAFSQLVSRICHPQPVVCISGKL